MSTRIAMIMAGGGGTRLWPMSTEDRPKPIAPHLGPGDATLLAATIDRVDALVDETWIVTTEALGRRILDATPGLDPARVIVEPHGRNTAPALALAVVSLRANLPDEATMIALPADHRVADPAGFRRCLRLACDLAETRETIVTLGITPTAPATGYGYLRLSTTHDPLVLGRGDSELSAFVVERFIEKPDAETARGFVDAGHHLWNAGIFVGTLSRWARDFARTCPEIWDPIAAAGPGAELEAAYAAVPRRPVDVAVMERLDDIIAVPAAVGWSDVGTWDAVYDALASDADDAGNVAVASAVAAVDAGGNLVITDELQVGLLGVDGLVVVQHAGRLLVTTRDRAAELRSLVDRLGDDDR